MEEKIAVIGGGSPYVPGILYSFAQTGETLSGSEISLMDIDPSRLPMMTKLGERVVEEAEAKLAITSTINLKEALNGATFVLTNFRPGGLEGLRLDEEIPNRYNILGQETCGPGGTFFALRAVPQVIDLCRSMEENCPDAWLINYTNPTNFVADAIRRESTVKCIALCDGGGNHLHYYLSRLMGLNWGEVRVRAAGTNHPANWLLELRVKEEDGYPVLLRQIREYSSQLEGLQKKITDFAQHFLSVYKVYPANPYYLYPYFNHDDALEEYRAGRYSVYRMFMNDLPTLWKNFEAMASGEKPIYMDPSKHHTHIGHGDLAVEVIVALATNVQKEFHVNIPNNGSVNNLPNGAIVEVPALIDSSGVRPISMGDLPKGVLGLTLSIINWEELTVDAALSGDKDMVLQSLLAHPKWPLTMNNAEQLCMEMLKAHAPYLPQFSG